jgi:hypothetical protein
MFRILAIAATLLGAASVAQADVYRWTDSGGTIHYSDQWVPGSVLVKTDRNRAAGSAPPVTSPTPAAGATRANEVVSEQQDKRILDADMAKAKADLCKQAREAYDKSIQSRRIFKTGANGQPEYLSDADADAYRLKLLNARKQVCGS